MESSLVSKLRLLEQKYELIKESLQQSYVISNQRKFQKLLMMYKRLHQIIENFQHWSKIEKEILSIQDFLQDPEMCDITQEELKILYKKKNKLEKSILFFLSQEEDDNRGCFLEIRAGTGGDEASLFCEKLFRMYSRFSEIHHWPIEILSVHDNEYGGYKEIIIKISYAGVYGRLKFESGGHRVQRIPETENQGRIHTSTCTVAVTPEYSEARFPKINFSDLRIDTFRSSGAGGQHVNTTDSAIRITHIPSGLVVECQNERSQHKNKSQALKILSFRLFSLEKEKERKERSMMKRTLLGSGDRSDRIRTYNFPKGRITDHRVNLTIYRLEEIMEGNLDILICPLLEALQIQKSLSNKIFYEEF